MARSVLDVAHILLKKRKFTKVIDLLDGSYEIYKENFDYFLTLGIACLYVGDTGSANSYFQKARYIRMTDITLLLCQAVLFLRRNECDRAIQYYLDVLEYDPQNAVALKAMDFIKDHGTPEEINHLVDSGKIKQFYPPLGVNPSVVFRFIFSAAAGVMAAFLLLRVPSLNIEKAVKSMQRADLSSISLSSSDFASSSDAVYKGSERYTLDDKQIKRAYDDARVYFESYRDNASRVEINRLLNSNASNSVKDKAVQLLSFFTDPDFGSFLNKEYKISDNYSYSEVIKDVYLYNDCWVSWGGRITNALSDGKAFSCDLLVGYEDMKRVDGIVNVYFEECPVPEIDSDRPVYILAQIKNDNGKIRLSGRAVYQPLGKTENY